MMSKFVFNFVKKTGTVSVSCFTKNLKFELKSESDSENMATKPDNSKDNLAEPSPEQASKLHWCVQLSRIPTCHGSQLYSLIDQHKYHNNSSKSCHGNDFEDYCVKRELLMGIFKKALEKLENEVIKLPQRSND